MKSIFFIAILISIISCTNNKQEVVNLEDIMPTSENYQEGKLKKDTSETLSAEVRTGLNVKLLNENNIELMQLSTSDTLLFPDRFTPLKLTKFTYTIDNETILIANYRFKDSLKTKNAFLNWTNCFGPKCKALRIGESSNLQKDGFLILANDTALVYISTNSISEQKKWINYFTVEKNSNWKFILSQTKNGKVKWNQFSDNQLTPIEDKVKIIE